MIFFIRLSHLALLGGNNYVKKYSTFAMILTLLLNRQLNDSYWNKESLIFIAQLNANAKITNIKNHFHVSALNT